MRAGSERSVFSFHGGRDVSAQNPLLLENRDIPETPEWRKTFFTGGEIFVFLTKIFLPPGQSDPAVLTL
jgi:hypothetical protein